VVLARDVRARLARHAAQWGMPRVIYLGNHGLFALGSSAAEALQLTEMADKVSRILGATLSFGNVVSMTEESVDRIDTRDDEQIRRTALARARLQHPGTE
jgi:ribulose-5-phosphate 4-epimerase/fuculose-1-phosphate aldolase